MQINPDINTAAYTIRSYGENEVNIYTPLTEEQILANMTSPTRQPIQHTKTLNAPLIVTTERLIENWEVEEPGALTQDHFKQLLELDVEIVILGTGRQIVFPDPKYTVYLQKHHVGLEVMSTEAACRTYNFLVSDGRKVAAALFMIKSN